MAGIPSPARPPASLCHAAPSAAGPHANYLVPLSVLTTLFFMWGGLTSLNDVLIPHLKGMFSLSYFEAMLVQFCFFGAYGLMSIPAGRFVKAIGFKNGIMVGLAGAALGCLMFYPGRGDPIVRRVPDRVLRARDRHRRPAGGGESRSWRCWASPRRPRRRLTLTQAFNSLATWALPDVHRADHPRGRGAVGGGAGEADARRAAGAGGAGGSASLRRPRARAGAAVGDRLAIEAPQDRHRRRRTRRGRHGGSADRGSAWRYRHLVLGAVAIFVYVGAEVAIGSLLVNYFKEPYTLGLAEARGDAS